MIDAHAHLINEKLDAEQIIQNMAQDKLDYIINIGTSLEDSMAGVDLAASHANVYCTVGIHPEYADDTTEEMLAQIENLAKQKKVVAIGEIGLDYHYEVTEQQKEKQKQIFERQVKIAIRQNLPIVIHCRDAAFDVLEILKKFRKKITNNICMHCYSEGASLAPAFMELGCYFSFTGNITFKKTDRSYLVTLPKDKIMVETDCPYLAPEPLRGTINQPKNVWLTAQKIADNLQMPLTKFEKMAVENTKRFYNIK